MFVLPPNPGEGDLDRVKRRPRNWWHLVMEGWEFLPENRRWDGDEREWISRGTGLHQISPSEWANGLPDRWWKALALNYAETRSLNIALAYAATEAGDNE